MKTIHLLWFSVVYIYPFEHLTHRYPKEQYWKGDALFPNYLLWRSFLIFPGFVHATELFHDTSKASLFFNDHLYMRMFGLIMNQLLWWLLPTNNYDDSIATTLEQFHHFFIVNIVFTPEKMKICPPMLRLLHVFFPVCIPSLTFSRLGIPAQPQMVWKIIQATIEKFTYSAQT